MILKDNCIASMRKAIPPLLPYAYSIREMRVSRDKDMPLVRGSTWMKDFPIFESLMCSLDVKKQLKGCFDLQNVHKERIPTAFGVNIILKKALPHNSALFVDKKKRIVGIYKDGELVYLSQRKYKKLREERGSA